LERQQPDLYLIALQDGHASGELYTLQQGQLEPASSDGLWLSEAFAGRDGWLIAAERISWADWLKLQLA
jgi:hypothetical protein